jgi:hypothetical protein
VTKLTRIDSGSDPMSYVCPRCAQRSYNPNDLREKYCGACHDWTGDVGLDDPLTQALLTVIAQCRFRAGSASNDGAPVERVREHRADAERWLAALKYRHDQLRRVALQDAQREGAATVEAVRAIHAETVRAAEQP